MPLAALSSENLINEILRDLDCAVSGFAAIGGDRLSGSRVASALSGQNDFAADDAAFYLDLARRMKRLQTDVVVPINWKKIDEIRNILGTRKTSSRPTPFCVVLIGSKLFKRISAGEVETTTDYQDCAAFKDFIIARQAATLLDGMGNFSVRTTTITNEVRNAYEFVTKLTDVGFEQ
jgi:hypothetical protein